MAVGRIKRIREIIDNGIPTKDHGHVAISNEEADEIKKLCKEELSKQDRREYHKTYYIKNPSKYNQKGKKKDAENSEV